LTFICCWRCMRRNGRGIGDYHPSRRRNRDWVSERGRARCCCCCRCHVMRARIWLCVAHVGVCVLFLYSWCLRAVLVFVVFACCSCIRGVCVLLSCSWCVCSWRPHGVVVVVLLCTCCSRAHDVCVLVVYSWCYSCARGVFMLLWSWWCVCVLWSWWCGRGVVVELIFSYSCATCIQIIISFRSSTHTHTSWYVRNFVWYGILSNYKS